MTLFDEILLYKKKMKYLKKAKLMEQDELENNFKLPFCIFMKKVILKIILLLLIFMK